MPTKPAPKGPARKVAAKKPADTAKASGRTRPAPGQDAINAKGLEAIAADLADGRFLREIARDLGVSLTLLIGWIEADPERSRACTRAREDAAAHWDREATEAIRNATNHFELMKARELAGHYRWRAKAAAPTRYGDRIAIDQKTELTAEQVDAKIAALMAKANGETA